LSFRLLTDGSVVAWFGCDAKFQGYPDRLHGGVIAMILDDAMTNCLLYQGITAVTGRLDVRYREPVQLGESVEVRAWIESRCKSLCRMRAELSQNGCLTAWAEAKFAETRTLGRLGPLGNKGGTAGRLRTRRRH
jgi:acyl-coenzyme A thioesterase PaaI-like protein